LFDVIIEKETLLDKVPLGCEMVDFIQPFKVGYDFNDGKRGYEDFIAGILYKIGDFVGALLDLISFE